MKRYEVVITFCEGDAVEVKNYRRGNRWEDGHVSNVTVSLYRDGRIHRLYRVTIDRWSPNGRRMHVTVGENDLRDASPRHTTKE